MIYILIVDNSIPNVQSNVNALINSPGPFQKAVVDPYMCYLLSRTHYRIVIKKVINLVLHCKFKHNMQAHTFVF
jgi:hypothetical protein